MFDFSSTFSFGDRDVFAIVSSVSITIPFNTLQISYITTIILGLYSAIIPFSTDLHLSFLFSGHPPTARRPSTPDLWPQAKTTTLGKGQSGPTGHGGPPRIRSGGAKQGQGEQQCLLGGLGAPALSSMHPYDIQCHVAIKAHWVCAPRTVLRGIASPRRLVCLHQGRLLLISPA